MAYSIHPIAAALAKALEVIGSKNFVARDKKQENLLASCKRIDPRDFNTLDMKTIASSSADEINRFLTRNGFDILLNQLNPGEFGVASILKILLNWIEEGKSCDINANGTKYKGVEMSKSIKLFRSSDSINWIVCITPEENFSLYLSLIDSVPENEQNMFAIANMLSTSKTKETDFELETLSFPEVDMSCYPDISWICGLESNDSIITQALMQTKFVLDTKGVEADAAVAFGIRKCISTSDPISLVFNKPFLAWIEKPGIDMPVFVAYCDYDSWKEI